MRGGAHRKCLSTGPRILCYAPVPHLVCWDLVTIIMTQISLRFFYLFLCLLLNLDLKIHSTQFNLAQNENNEPPLVITGQFRSQLWSGLNWAASSGQQCWAAGVIVWLMWSRVLQRTDRLKNASGNEMQDEAQHASAKRKCVPRATRVWIQNRSWSNI